MKIAVFYYTQTGQALAAAKSLFSEIERPAVAGEKAVSVLYKSIIPVQDYPFPWTSDVFFDTFPETRLSMPPSGIKPLDFSDIQDADIVVIVGQSWFLSPSLPLQSFFADEAVKDYLHGRQVVFMNVCRNMWLMTSRWLKDYLKTIGANLVGQIILQDKVANWVSALTIVRWLLYGKKESTGMLPRAGVSEDDLQDCRRLGVLIAEAVEKGTTGQLQDALLDAGAIRYQPSIVYIEKIGHRIFGYWARFIRRKGGFRDPRRKGRVRMFFYYLLFVLFVLSPFAQLLFYLTYPLHRVGSNKRKDCQV